NSAPGELMREAADIHQFREAARKEHEAHEHASRQQNGIREWAGVLRSVLWHIVSAVEVPLPLRITSPPPPRSPAGSKRRELASISSARCAPAAAHATVAPTSPPYR